MNKVIRPLKNQAHIVQVPGSKSFTHRALICAALANGTSTVKNGLVAQDTLLTKDGLGALGAVIDRDQTRFTVQGAGGKLTAPGEPVYLHNSGTSIRLLTAVASLADGPVTLAGSERMAERPIGDLLDALEKLGVGVEAKSPGQCPPVVIQGPVTGRETRVNCKISSQFLSGLLLMAPYTPHGLDITVSEGPVSRPYIDMTVRVMENYGVKVKREGYERFFVGSDNKYRAGDYTVETDASNASYFWAAGAVSGHPVTVADIGRDSIQGDIRLLEVFEQMGCTVAEGPDGVYLRGGDLVAVEVDMGDMPDMVPTLAVVAAFARGTTIIRNVAHLKAKETDRLGAVVNELKKMGVDASCDNDSMTVVGGGARGAGISTYDDHRMAMAFSVAGLMVSNQVITEAGCVEKSFPGFWDVWENMTG